MDNGYPTEETITALMTSLGLEIPVESNPNYFGEFKQFLWGLINATRWSMSLAVYCPSPTTFNVRGGDYTFGGAAKTYTPSTAVDPTDNDTTYIWMDPDNTIDSGIDGSGWPTTDHIKLAEIDVNSSGVITDVRDQRGLAFLKSNDGLMMLGSSVVDLNAAGGTEVALCTAPTGKVGIIDHVLLHTLSADALAAVITIGKTGGDCDEFVGDQVLADLDATTKAAKIAPSLFKRLTGSDTWDAASIADGDEEAKEVTVTGAALGDFVRVSFSLDVADLVLDAKVTAANTVTCILANNTGGAIDLGSGTISVEVFKVDQPAGLMTLAAAEALGVEITTPAGAACTAIFMVLGRLVDA